MGTKATREELGDLGVVYARLFEFVKNGKRPAKDVISAMQRLTDVKLPKDSRFDCYKHFLLSLDEQLKRLRRYNAQYWGYYLTDNDLNDVITSSDHNQQVNDLENLHVEFSSTAQTVEMWWKVFVGEQPASWRWDELMLDPNHFRLCPNTARYEPGIHRVRINLVAHWEPETARTLIKVQNQAKSTGETLAHTEVLSTYGLHSELLREMDGKNLPYSDLPGSALTVPGGSRLYALCVNWSPIDCRANLAASSVGSRNRLWSAPVVTEVQR
jgi:hypothetical protein